MPKVKVPDLKRKFALIRSYSQKQWRDLAAEFNVSEKTLQYWAHGAGPRDPDFMPGEALPVLTRLVAGMLPPDTPDERVRDLVYGSADQLEAKVRTAVAASLAAILAAEGRRNQARLFRRNELGLVEYDDAPEDAVEHRLQLGEWFRIEVPLVHPCRYAVVLQNAQQSWAVVASSIRNGVVLIPGRHPDGDPSFMCERRDLGRHLFVCLQSVTPFSAALEAYRREGTILDRSALNELAGAYQALPAKQRACHVLTVEFEPDPT